MAPAPHHGSFRRLLVVACSLVLLLCRRAGAVEYVVGDGDFGWDSGINYATWAQKHTFAVGDALVFQYVSSQHNVYEVSESTYRSCDAAGDNGVLAKYTSGHDTVLLAEARSYFFICDFPGHCLGGMKLAVNVSAAGGPSSPPNAASPPIPSAASSSLCRGWLPMGLALAVLEFIVNWAI